MILEPILGLHITKEYQYQFKRRIWKKY